MRITTRTIIIAAGASLLASITSSLAIEGLQISLQSPDVVLSWPSHGYEHYLIQYRPTLDTNTPWAELTNNYPANSTNQTTFTIGGVLPAGDSMLENAAAQFVQVEQTILMAKPKNGLGATVPLNLYPPALRDPNKLDIFETNIIVRVPQSATTDTLQTQGALDGPTGDNPPSMGFFRVFHIPDWSFNVTNYIYDGPTFFPVDFADYRELIDDIKALLDGQETEYAEFMPDPSSSSQTNWGMGIYLDRFPSGNHTIQLVSTLRLNDLMGEDTFYLPLSNLVRTITIANQITFTNWTETIQGTPTPSTPRSPIPIAIGG